MQLHALPDDVLTKILNAFVAHCDGLPFVWRLVCRDLRYAARTHSFTSSLQLLGTSSSLVRMMRAWIRCKHTRAFEKCTLEGFPLTDTVDETDLLDAVVAYNNVPVFEELMQEKWVRKLNKVACAGTYGLPYHASRNGALDVLKVLMHMHMSVGSADCKIAIGNGHADVVAWFLELQEFYDNVVWMTHDYNTYVKRFPHPTDPSRECVVDLREQFCDLRGFFDEFLGCAVMRGHLYITELLIPYAKKVDQYDPYALARTAAQHNQLKILKWLVANTTPSIFDDEDCNFDVLFEASFHGHLDTLKWLVPEHIPWIDHRTAFAHNADNLELTKWLVEEMGMELRHTHMLVAMAAYDRTSDFAVMDYLHSKNCPRFDPNHPDLEALPVGEYPYLGEYESAVANMSDTAHELVQWLYDHGYKPPVLREEQYAMKHAMACDDVAMVVKLISVGFDFQPEWYGCSDYYQRQGRKAKPYWSCRAVVKWARENGYEIPPCKRARKSLSR